MPRLGARLYLAIDAGPIYDSHGQLLAVIETLRDMTSLKNAQSELERLATHDGLTGIVNRRGFDEKLSMEWSRAIRDKLPLALIMIDVDHFKRYNDAYGHQMGDDCLKSVAKGISPANLRSSDVVARYGGEEFALILPSSDEKGAAKVATKIQERIAKLAIPHRGNEELGVVTVSIGVAVISPQQGMKLEDLISQADRALYRAKNKGRNRIEIQTMS
jgi:diguanylate cyclase (GGDEF)-like protein